MSEDSDFDRWLAYHVQRFTGVASWFAKFPDTARSSFDATRSSVRRAWMSELDRFSFEELKTATDRMFGGDEPVPKMYEEHPAAVKRLAQREHNRSAPRPSMRYGGEVTVACITCLDRGYVTCYSPQTIDMVNSGLLTIERHRKGGFAFTGGYPYTMGVPCVCSAGDRDWELHKKGNVPPRYAPSRYCRQESVRVDEMYAEIQDYIANGGVDAQRRVF